MAMKIRLARGGSKKRPHYSIVAADSRMPRDGRYIEKIGSYDPMLGKEDPNRVQLVEERVRHWLSVGALPSDRVARFLGRAEILPVPAVPTNQTKQHLPKAKAQERMREAEEAASAAKEAAAAAAAEAAEAAAAPAEEAPAEVSEDTAEEAKAE